MYDSAISDAILLLLFFNCTTVGINEKKKFNSAMKLLWKLLRVFSCSCYYYFSFSHAHKRYFFHHKNTNEISSSLFYKHQFDHIETFCCIMWNKNGLSIIIIQKKKLYYIMPLYIYYMSNAIIAIILFSNFPKTIIMAKGLNGRLEVLCGQVHLGDILIMPSDDATILSSHCLYCFIY